MPKVKIKGTIISNDYKWIYDIFDVESTCPKDVSDILDKANGEELDIEINSGGGDVYSGSEIYAMLKGYAGRKTVKIMGLAASAASVIAMSGDKVMIAPTAQIMIHNVWSRRAGDYRDMEHESEVLKNWNDTTVNAYILKTGMSRDELLAMMDKETWLTPVQAKELKFADEIMFDEQRQLAAAARTAVMIPPEIINKLRNLLPRPTGNSQSTNEASVEKERLELLKLRRIY